MGANKPSEVARKQNIQIEEALVFSKILILHI
jgi:hypothetical protein